MKQISFFLFLVFLGACTVNNEEDYFSDFDCNWETTDFSLFNPDAGCVLENLSFQSHILNIIDSKCNSCHGTSNTNGINLTTYNNLLSYDFCFQIDNDLMPPVGIPQLTECEKLQIKTWVENGLAE